jgi:YVTN family beta-propeller protein
MNKGRTWGIIDVIPFKLVILLRNPILSILYFLSIVVLLLAFPSLTASMIMGVALADSSNTIADQDNQPIVTNAGIAVNTFPVGVAVNPSTNIIYVTNEYSNTLSVINADNDKVEHTISVGNTPYDVDVDPVTDKIYVANLGSNSISIIDGSTNSILGNIENVTTPVGLDVDSDRSWIYVTNIENNTVSKIDAVTNKIVKNITVGKNPYSVDISKGRNEYKIYVTNTGSNTTSVINGDSFELLKNITVGKFPVGLAANALTNTVYVANRESNIVSVINGSSDTVVKNITVGKNPDGIDINFKTNMVYVTNTGSNTVSVINGSSNTVTRTITVNNDISPELESQERSLPPTVWFPNVASFIDVNQGTNMVYVTNTGSNTVSVINGSSSNLVVGLTFNIDPFNSGNIKCINKNDKNEIYTYSTDKYVRVSFGKNLECTSYSNSDYKFNFWSGDIAKNFGSATSPMAVPNVVNSIVDWFMGLFSSNSPPITFAAINYNEDLQANFKTAPDYMALLVLPIIFGAITFSIHGIRQIYKKIRNKLNEGNYLRRHNKTISDAYNASQRSKIEASQRLTQIRNDIIHDYYKGNMKESNYEDLMNSISYYFQKIRSIQK